MAIKDYTKALEIDPELNSAYFNRGHAYQKFGFKDKAEADFKQARCYATVPKKKKELVTA